MEMNEETDLEALQAQIDLSNSVAFDIVSSWMKPSTSNTKPVPLRTTTMRDLEELAHRPPRLGLGAKVSKSTIATAQDTAKLRGKLSKKQPIPDNAVADDSNKRKNNDEDEDEEESRNTVITQRKTTAGSSKRVIDVFSLSSNKKRKRSNSHSEVLKTTDSSGTVDNDPSTTTLLAPAAHISPPSKKRKDKGKNKEQVSNTNSHSHLFDEEEWTGLSAEVLEGIYNGIVPNGPPSTPSPPPSLSKGDSARRISSLSPISHPALFRGFSVDDQKISLLNLHGPPPPPPPPPIEEGDKSSTVGSDKKKKRRRKRKKRKKRKSDQTQGPGDT